jgi:hypothetical protein
VCVVERAVGGVVKRISKRQFEPRADGETGRAAALKRAGPKRLLEPLAYGLEVDPKARERVWVDLPWIGSRW